MNGILYSIFAKNKKIIYTNGYPASIYKINFRIKKNNFFSKYENSVKVFNKNSKIKKNIKYFNKKEKLSSLDETY